MKPTKPLKRFEIHFRHRQTGQLEDVFESGEAVSQAAAVRWAKAVAVERGWWFISANPAREVPVSIVTPKEAGIRAGERVRSGNLEGILVIHADGAIGIQMDKGSTFPVLGRNVSRVN